MYVCSADHGGEGVHTWLRSQQPGAQALAAEGVTGELLEPMLACVVPDEPFAEYGVVEYRFRERYPALFRAHVRDRGHVLMDTPLVTASAVRFGFALSRLARPGELVRRFGPATGAWAYNGEMSYWAVPPAPQGQPMTWAAYCARVGRSAQWTDEDRAACLGRSG